MLKIGVFMLDIRLFRESPEIVIHNLTKRGMDTSKVQEIIDLDKLRREKITSVNTLNSMLNIPQK